MNSQLQKMVILLILVLVAFVMCVGYIQQVAFEGDLRGYFAPWAVKVHNSGLFNVYVGEPQPDYPPMYLAMLGVVAALNPDSSREFISLRSPASLPLLKLFPVLFEIGIVVIAFLWLQDRPRWRWMVPALLAICPGLVITSAQWGQADSIFTLFLVGVLIALNRDKPRIAWLIYALAFLTKFQAIVLAPLILILCFRRYGVRRLIEGAVIYALVMAAGLLPFIAGSGVDNTLHPYLGTVDSYPATTVNAFNLWYLVTPPTEGGMLTWGQEWTPDREAAIGGMSYKTLGFALLGVYVLVISGSMWLRYKDRLEFVWATALYLAFFMLPTQIHERYLYPAVVFAIFALAQERRMWVAALGVSLTYLYNVLYVIEEPFYLFGFEPLALLSASVVNWMILLNLALLLDLLFILLRPQISRRLQLIPAAATGGAAAGILFFSLFPSNATLPECAVQLNTDVGNYAVLEGYQVTHEDSDYEVTLYWRSAQPSHDDLETFIEVAIDGRRMLDQEQTMRLWQGKRQRQTYNFKIVLQKPIKFYTGIGRDRIELSPWSSCD